MKRYFGLLFWTIVSVLLILYFGVSTDNYVYSFYFVSFFIPINIATSQLINRHLIPEYLLQRLYGKFILYTFYTLVVSLYLVMLLGLVALMVLNLYDNGNMFLVISNYKMIPVLLYSLVLVTAFVSIVRRYMELESKISLKEKEESTHILIRANRQNRRILFPAILYLESMSDYVLIHLVSGEKVVTRETITNLVEMLPGHFIRIHRSFVVNFEKLDSFNKEQITVSGEELPISRTYKKRVTEILNEKMAISNRTASD